MLTRQSKHNKISMSVGLTLKLQSRDSSYCDVAGQFPNSLVAQLGPDTVFVK